jgi:uncharacterized membrane protein YqjE
MSLPGKGLFDSGKQALGSLVDLVLVRVELFGTELEAEKLRLLDTLLHAIMGVVLLTLALVGAMGFVLLLFWDGYRLAALGVLTLLLAAAGTWLLMLARGRLRSGSGPFALTLGELRQDRDRLRPDGTALPSSAPAADPAAGRSTRRAAQ